MGIKFSKGFTLIELLVVISIIGVLSSVVLASLKTARDKGTIAAGLQYEGYVQRTQGDRAVLWWKFNDTGTVATDSTGLSHSGTFTGSSFGIFGFASGLALNAAKDKVLNVGGAQYVTADISSTPDVSSSGFTMMAWINPNTAVDGAIIGRSLAYLLRNSTGSLSFNMYCGGCAGSTWALSGGSVNTGTWTHVAGVYDQGISKIYINGKEVARSVSANPNPVSANGGAFTVGARIFGATIDRYFSGQIDDAFYSNEALSTAQIQKNYAETAPAFLAAK